MRIGFFGDGIWAHNAFTQLNRNPGIEIAFVCGRYSKTDHVLESLSKEHSIEWLVTENINKETFIRKLTDFQCNLFVSMSFDQIFRPGVFNIPPQKTINCHAGKLPFYRGRNVLNWVLINDEKEFGITVHYIDAGIDTGDIIAQRSFPVTDDDTYATLLNLAHVECANILYEAVLMIRENDVHPIPQSIIHPVGMYCTGRKHGDENLDWNMNSRDIFNFVRAISLPGPMARTWANGHEVCINKVEMVENAPAYKGIPGSVLFRQGDHLFIKTKDTMVKITDYRADGPFLKPGDRFSVCNQ